MCIRDSYCEMLPIEYRPTASYMEAYEAALKSCGKETGEAIAAVSEKILKEKGEKVVLVSLARAGTPIGILIKHYIKKAYGIDAPHYTISIIRGRGIDKNAMKYLLNQYEGKQLQFVDGWIGKGAILQVLREAVKEFPTVSCKLAVAADPANVTELCGTHEDILIPSSCLNSTVSGLMSRTFLRNDIIGPEDFHGAVYYEELEKEDKSYEFIQAIEQWFPEHGKKTEERKKGTGLSEVDVYKRQVQVVMITGDRKDTAVAIAKESGIVKSEEDLILTSDELAKMSDDQVKECLKHIRRCV